MHNPGQYWAHINTERIELLRPLAGLLALDEGPAAAMTADMQGSSRASQPLDDAAADATRAAATANTPPAA